MEEWYFPTETQLFKLYDFLTFLKNAEIYWHEIWMSEDIIKIKIEPQKGEFDIRIFNIYNNGELDDDGFRKD